MDPEHKGIELKDVWKKQNRSHTSGFPWLQWEQTCHSRVCNGIQSSQGAAKRPSCDMEIDRHPHRQGECHSWWMRRALLSAKAVDKQNTPSSYDDRVSYKKVAATYSPTWWGSTIGDGELNFSVRNGKRWILTAITATVCFWEKINDALLKNNRPRVHHAACCRIFLGYFLKESMLPPVYIAVKVHRNPIQRKMSGY